jgi:hypothetical protein
MESIKGVPQKIKSAQTSARAKAKTSKDRFSAAKSSQISGLQRIAVPTYIRNIKDSGVLNVNRGKQSLMTCQLRPVGQCKTRAGSGIKCAKQKQICCMSSDSFLRSHSAWHLQKHNSWAFVVPSVEPREHVLPSAWETLG